ncbi:hypothetical protein [Altererythrobacter sp. MF3-039]|uniref:hypothetical protein n=1 Tax=Altererythrobacter sp. MF3-039 TaxID=3252901 RepID=UPI00390CD5A6
MKLPEIDLDEIPGLPTKTGVYGSMSGGGGGSSDDTVIVVMVFVYNSTHSEGR